MTRTPSLRFRRLSVVAIAAASLLVASVPAMAQKSNRLGFSEVSIVIESLDDDARKCGITEDGLDATVRLPIAALPQLRVLSSNTGAGNAYVYANVNVMRLDSGVCVANFEVHAKRWASEFGWVVSVWNKGGIMSGGSGNFGSRVRQAVEDLTKEFLAEWLRARTP